MPGTIAGAGASCMGDTWMGTGLRDECLMHGRLAHGVRRESLMKSCVGEPCMEARGAPHAQCPPATEVRASVPCPRPNAQDVALGLCEGMRPESPMHSLSHLLVDRFWGECGMHGEAPHATHAPHAPHATHLLVDGREGLQEDAAVRGDPQRSVGVVRLQLKVAEIAVHLAQLGALEGVGGAGWGYGWGGPASALGSGSCCPPRTARGPGERAVGGGRGQGGMGTFRAAVYLARLGALMRQGWGEVWAKQPRVGFLWT